MLNYGQWQGHVTNYKIINLDENFAISRTLKLDTKCPQNLLFTKKTNFNNLHLALERVFQKKVSFEITQDILTPWLVPYTI